LRARFSARSLIYPQIPLYSYLGLGSQRSERASEHSDEQSAQSEQKRLKDRVYRAR